MWPSIFDLAILGLGKIRKTSHFNHDDLGERYSMIQGRIYIIDLTQLGYLVYHGFNIGILVGFAYLTYGFDYCPNQKRQGIMKIALKPKKEDIKQHFYRQIILT
jgi:hypothetical protein